MLEGTRVKRPLTPSQDVRAKKQILNLVVAGLTESPTSHSTRAPHNVARYIYWRTGDYTVPSLTTDWSGAVPGSRRGQNQELSRQYLKSEL